MAHPSYLCGCYFNGSSGRQYLPLLESEFHSTILSTTTKTILKQTFTNPSLEEPIKECIHTFPLYDGVSVVDFTCKIDTRILRGVVKEKVKAKELFDEAVAKGETAGLLEQAPEASDIFSTKLGNVPAGKSVVVEITYIGELKHHGTDGIRFTIPTCIAPRYGQGPSHAVGSGSQVQQKGGIKITVDVNMPQGTFIKGVESPSHPIAVSLGALSKATVENQTMNKASATLSLGTAALEKDFVIIIISKDVGIPKAILETHPTIPNHRALMMTLVPQFSLPPSRPEIVFVADRSGSMHDNIPMLVSAMKVFLKSMPLGVKFNICSFGNYTNFLWPQSKSYTSETLQEAMSHIEVFSANMGGTETFKAIESTIKKRLLDLPLEIILLTDGDIWRQEELFTYINQQVKNTDGKIRIFPLGIGNGVSSALIEGLARAGNGFAQSVQNGERLDNSVVRMLRGALSPHITDYTLEVKYEKEEDDDFELIDKVTEGLKVLLSDTDKIQPLSQEPKPTISLFDPSIDPEKEDIKIQNVDCLPKIPYPKILQAPHKIPTLFAFSRTTVYLLMSPETVQRNPTAVVLHATSASGPLALDIPIEALSTPATTIHQLGARKACQDLEEGRGWLFDAKDEAEVPLKDRLPSRFEDLVQREAVRLGETFQVASKWCSFVAVAANDAGFPATLATISSAQSVPNMQVSQKKQEKTRQRLFKKRSMISSSQVQGLSTKNFDKAFDDGGADGSDRKPYAHPQAQSAPYSQGQMPVQSCAVLPSRGPLLDALPPPPANSFGPCTAPGPASSMFGQQCAPQRPLGSLRQNEAPAPALSPTIGTMHSASMRSARGAGGVFFRAGKILKNASVMPLKAGGGTTMSTPAHFTASYSAAASDVFTNSAPATVNWATQSVSQKVHALISIQDFEGSWSPADPTISLILGLDEIPKAPEGVDGKTWVTLLVTAYLEVNCAAEEGTWELVVEKARDWLSAVTGLDAAWQKAREAVEQ